MDRHMALAFGLPALIMAFAFACTRVWPFGDQSVLTIDLYHMYATLIAHLHDIIYEGAGGAWSWNIGGGINYFTLYLTNVGSPLNGVIALFPKAWLPDLIGLGMVVKAGLCGLCMGWLLRFKWRSCDLWTVAFATMYALCGWMTNYYWNIMWADLLFLLPLCLIGIELIIGHGRWGVYVAALVAAMVCNYYIAVLMCVFLLLYFIVAVLSRFSLLREKRWILGRSLLFGGMSLLAAGLAALCLLPVAKALLATSVISDAMPKWELYHSFTDVLKNALPGAEANIRSGGLPHTYAGLLCVWLVPLWLSDRRSPLKWRLLSLLGLAAMYGVMNIKALDFIWHGLHTPNDLPFRYSFCISALLVITAYPAARRISRRTLPGLLAWGGAILVFLAVTELVGEESPNIPRLVAVPVLILVFCALFWLCFVRGRLRYETLQVVALGLVCIELGFCTTWAVWGTSNTTRSLYENNIRTYSRVAKTVTQIGGDGFYRVENDKYMTLNDPALYGFKGLSHFSSMLGADLQDLMHKLGYQSFMNGNVRANRQAGQPNTPVVDSLLGVRYLISRTDDDLASLSPGLRRQVWADSQAAVLENPYALPLAFQADEQVLTEWDYNQSSPFAVQNQFVALATGVEGVLRDLPDSHMEEDGLSLFRSVNNSFRYADSDTGSPGSAMLTYRVDSEEYLYFYADGDQMSNISAEVRAVAEDAEPDPEGTDETETAEAEVLRKVSCDGRYPKVLELGLVSPGQEVVVTIKLGRTRADGTVRAWMAALDTAAFEAAFGQMQADGLLDIRYSNSRVWGTSHAADGMALVTTIPADAGWKLYIDDRESEIVPVGGAFVGALLPSGEHRVELRWTLPGFDLGVKISLCSLVLLALIWAITRQAPPRPAPLGPVYEPWEPELDEGPSAPEEAEPFDGTAGQDLTAYWLAGVEDDEDGEADTDDEADSAPDTEALVDEIVAETRAAQADETGGADDDAQEEEGHE